MTSSRQGWRTCKRVPHDPGTTREIELRILSPDHHPVVRLQSGRILPEIRKFPRPMAGRKLCLKPGCLARSPQTATRILSETVTLGSRLPHDPRFQQTLIVWTRQYKTTV